MSPSTAYLGPSNGAAIGIDCRRHPGRLGFKPGGAFQGGDYSIGNGERRIVSHRLKRIDSATQRIPDREHRRRLHVPIGRPSSPRKMSPPPRMRAEP